MSAFYDLASLVVVPSGYKASKVYAQKPLTTDGQLTFSRGSTATRVNSAGLIEKVRTNLLTYSNDFSNAAWTKTNVTLTTGQADPNGGLTATTVDATNGTSAFVRQNISITSGVKYTWSVYIKGSTTGQSIALYTDGASNIYEIKALTTSWQRFTGVATAASSGSSGFYILCGSGYSGLTDLPFDIAFGQVEASDIATAYIPTTSAAVSVGPVANVPRLDYLGSTCPKLQLEPSRTNIQLNSEDFLQSNWSKTNSAVVTNQVASPDGYVNADKLNETAVNNIHQLESSRSVSSSTAYTMSVFAKKAERSWIRIYEDTTSNSAYFNLDSGTVGTVGGPTAVAKIENYGNGWYRCSVTYTETGTFGRYRIATAKQDNETSYLGVANNGIYVWGAQYEAGAYPSSYIGPTLGAAVTRGADACSKTGISSLIGQTEGTLFAEVDLDYVLTGIILAIGDGTANNRFVIQFTNATTLFCTIRIAGVNVDYSVTVPAIPANGGIFKIALGYKTNDYVFALNGVIYSPSTATRAVPACSALYVGQSTFSANQLEGAIKQTLLFKTRLTNAQLAELTTL